MFKNNTRVNRPIIFKVASNYDKQMIMNHLKQFIESRLKENPSSTKIFVTEHLPKAFYQQKRIY